MNRLQTTTSLEWDSMSEKDQLLQYVSDMYKSAYGVRPRGFYDDHSVEQLKVLLDDLSATADEVYEQEQKQEQANIVAFENLIAETISNGAGNRKTALRWLLDDEYDVGYFAYMNGFDQYTKVGLALIKELEVVVKEVS